MVYPKSISSYPKNMRKLNTETRHESPDLIKAYSNQMPTKNQILEIIDHAKKFEKGKSLDTLRQIIEGYNKKDHKTKPNKFSEEIRTIGETAYQRAIFLSKQTKLNTIGEVAWNDMELPIVFNESSRRRCVDLIGTLDNNVSVLCELKFASKKSNSNSPIYAVIELLIYYYLIKDNYEELDSKHVFHGNRSFEWGNFNYNSIFIVGANEKYWTYWQKRYEKRKNELELWFRSLPLRIRLFSSVDFDFEKQKGVKNKYIPSVFDKTEWTEVHM
jgi:hypothetical protein